MEAPRPARPMQGQSSIYPQADKGERSGGYGTLLTDADLAPERETAKEPAKRWRNKWRVIRTFKDVSRRFAKGDTLVSREEWPSREVAEQKALDERQEYAGAFASVGGNIDDYVEHLGAFPVDESGEPL